MFLMLGLFVFVGTSCSVAQTKTSTPRHSIFDPNYESVAFTALNTSYGTAIRQDLRNQADAIFTTTEGTVISAAEYDYSHDILPPQRQSTMNSRANSFLSPIYVAAVPTIKLGVYNEIKQPPLKLSYTLR